MLRRTTAPTRMKFRRIAPQVACAKIHAFQKQRAEALRLCRAPRGCNDGVLAVDGL
jgi:hypothetical protein